MEDTRHTGPSTRRAARTVTKHLTGSRFQPCALEVRFDEFAPAVVLHTDLGDVPLKGRVDRVDAWTDADETWLRVIDYKRGGKALNLDAVYHGLSLQLPVYLAAAMKNIEAAGYQIVMHIHDEVILDAPADRADLDTVCKLMCQPIPWAEGLLLNADGFVGDYYKKD